MQYSEVGQDIFALSVANCKSYIEIGAADPITYNNTLLLEQNGWEGFSLELDNKFKEDWNQKRQNLCVYEDAVNFKYFDIKRYGYLSCDINPPELTLAALKNVISQGIEFDCITFEHDDYWHEERGFERTLHTTTEYLKANGYKIAVDNVFCVRRRKAWTGECHFETWYVNKDIDFDTIDYRVWLNNSSI
jgi:hypothetical protein|tara:strand:- start:1656 stop:2225 length:570 start_codon:yes stop_codon:yes gene_type:complete